MSLTNKASKVLNNKKKRIHEFWFLKYFRKSKIKKNTVLIESTHGRSFNGHLYHLTKAMLENDNLSINIVIRDTEALETFLSDRKINHKNVNIVEHLSKEYCKLLATSEVLINDTTFWPFFNKKEGQKYYIIWHGTPLKKLGKDTGDIVDVANVQRNFYMADKLIVSNEYTKDKLIEAMNLKGVYSGDVVVAPSPRNAALFNRKFKEDIRRKYAPNGEKIIVYMPTWRGTVDGVVNTENKLYSDLIEISKGLDVNEKFYVKLHPFQNKSTILSIPNIYPFPEDEELYEFLAGTDILITDYSSIMYDFLNLDKKIILYTYDKEEYYSTRGVYEDVDTYPLPVVESIHDLISEIKNEDINDNQKDMKEVFCSKDSVDGAKILSNYLFGYNQTNSNIDEYNIHNGKETVVILGGGFWDNGITTALINTLESVDTSKRNYIVFFGRNKLKPQHYFRINNLPENVLFFPIPGSINATLLERFIIKRYLFTERFSFKVVEDILDKLFKRQLYRDEYKRIFGDLKVDYFVHYTGFDRKYAEMSKHIDPKTIMFVHTDMIEEYKAKKSFGKRVIYGAYEKSESVVLVNERLRSSFVKELPHIDHKIKIVNNFLGAEKIKNLAEENFVESLLEVNVDFAYSNNFLDDIKESIIEEKNRFLLEKQKNNYVHSENSFLEMINGLMENSLELEIKVNQELDFFSKVFALSKDYLESYFSEHNITISNYKKHKIKLEFVNSLNDYYENGKIEESFPYIKQQEHMITNLESDDIDNPLTFKYIGIDKLRLIENLLDPGHKVFINIGRYDYEKGHDRLIKSFELVNQSYPNTSLVIVAPHGKLKNETIGLASNSIARENIFILGRMSNPYALLSKCDAFVLSSYYEGLGLAAFEAMAVGIDLITVNLPGTVKNLEDKNAIIVESTQEALYNGMRKYIEQEHEFVPFNFEKQNRISIEEFDSIFE